MKKMNPFIVKCIITIILIITALFLFYDRQKNLKNKCTTGDPYYISICMQRGNLYPQEQYDFYYKIAANNPSIDVLTDDLFFLGFQIAHQNCYAYSYKDECDMHNPSVYKIFREKCIVNINYISSFCIDSLLRYEPLQDDIDRFVNLISKQIKLHQNKPPYTCNNALTAYYYKIPHKLTEKIPQEVKDACERKNKNV